jgi:plastocyanin
MNLPKTILLLLVALIPVRGAAVVEGKVNLAAAPKLPSPPSTARYQNKPPIGPPEPRTAIVYLEGTFPASTNKAAKLEQRHYQFAPGLLAVQKGTTVEFPNFDDDYHSVFSLSKSKRFDLGRYRKEEKPATQTFNAPGVVRLYCDIHEHMRATILVLDTPYFTRTDKNGNFKLEGLPAGSYKLKAWLEEQIIWERPVELKDGETLKVDISGK